MPDTKCQGFPSNQLTLLPFLLLALMIMLAGCAQYDNEVGGSLVDNEVAGVLRDTLLPVERLATMTRGDIVKLNAANLPLGIQNGMRSDILLRFSDLSALEDTTLELDSAKLKLFGNGFVDSSRVVDFTPWEAVVYRIESDWDPLEYTFEDSLSLTPIDTMVFDTTDLGDVDPFSIISIPINIQSLKNQMVDTLAYGIRISPSQSTTFLTNYASRFASDAADLPVLEVYTTFQDGEEVTNDTISIFSDVSAYVTNDTIDLPDNRLYISEGFSRFSLFHTDLTNYLPAMISLNKVELFMHTDTTSSASLGETDVLTVADIRNGWDESEPDTTTIGESSRFFYNITNDTSLVRLDITPLARLWLVSPEDNFGVAVRSINDSKNIGRRAFFDNSADPVLRPMIRVFYTEFDTP